MKNNDTRPMNEDESRVLMSMMLGGDEGIDEMYDAMIKDIHIATIIHKRNVAMELGFDKKSLIMGVLMSDRPAKVILFLITCLEKLGKFPTFDDIVNQVYPMGFPTEEAWKENWQWLKSNHNSIEYGYVAMLGE